MDNRRGHKNKRHSQHEHETNIFFYDDRKVITLINKLIKLNTKIMDTLKDVKDELAVLKTTVAEERSEARAKLDELNAKIDELLANNAGGGTAAERAELIAEIKTMTGEVKDIIPDTAQPEA